jgi:HEAT repeat protein
MRWFLASLACALLAHSAVAQDTTYQGKTVKQWTAQLKHPDMRFRFQALLALKEAGSDAEPAVGDIAKLLKDPVPSVRRAAVQVLAGLDNAAIPGALGQAMRDVDPGVRNAAAKGLTELGDKGQEVLLEAMADKDSAIRLLALNALDSMDGPSKEVIKAIGQAVKDASPAVKKRALFILAQRVADDPEARPFVAQALRDKDQKLRTLAAQALVGAGAEVAEDLVKAAKEGDAGTRLIALQALGALGEELPKEGLTALVGGLEDSDAKVRQAAAAGIGQLKAKARERAGPGLFKDLAKLAADKEVTVRRAAVFAMGSIGVADADEVNKISEALKDKDVYVRGFAAMALGNCANEDAAEEIATAALTHLAMALRDTDNRVGSMAAGVLIREEKRSVPVLIPIVEKGMGKQRLWAAQILGEIGSPFSCLSHTVTTSGPATHSLSDATGFERAGARNRRPMHHRFFRGASRCSGHSFSVC